MSQSFRLRRLLWRLLGRCGRGWLLFAVLALASACSSAAPEETSVVGQSSGLPGATVTKPPPLIKTVSGPESSSSFTALDEAQVAATVSRLAPTQVTAAAADRQTPTSNPTPGHVQSTNTPLPTFTPPSPEIASVADHLWLARPILQGGAVWTDKAYPYGATRGGILRTHHGVEFNVPAGTEVVAAASGTVVVAGDDSASLLGESHDFYGLVVVVQLDLQLDGKPIFNLYGHLSEIRVEVGQPVRLGDVLALSGSSGVADGAHLHFEVRVGENAYQATRNPLLWLYPFPERGVVAGRVSWPGGELAREVPITLRRIDAPSPYAATVTYADEGVNPDDSWQENFVLDDVMAGYYELTAGSGEGQVKVELWVHAYKTSFVDIVLPG